MAYLRRSVWSSLIAVLAATAAVAVAAAVNKKFPFDPCVTSQANSPYYATFYNYTETPKSNTSKICFRLGVAANCTPGGYRCCNTYINKIKLFPALNCRGSVSKFYLTTKNASVAVDSYYFEEHYGYDIVKFTPLAKWLTGPDTIDGAIACVALRKPCWTWTQFSYNTTTKFTYALYDKKVNNYECCPTGNFGMVL